MQRGMKGKPQAIFYASTPRFITTTTDRTVGRCVGQSSVPQPPSQPDTQCSRRHLGSERAERSVPAYERPARCAPVLLGIDLIDDRASMILGPSSVAVAWEAVRARRQMVVRMRLE